MLERFEQVIYQNKLCTRDDQILLAVSGGVDSMVMLDLFNRGGYKISVAHCNFQLRGEASNLDEALVKTICANLNVPFYQSRFNTETYVTQNKISVQMAARQLRYDWFKELINERKLDMLATAHHLNDNLETILLNLTRGTGFNGLVGIPIKKNKIIRPLTYFTRSEILEYAKNNSLLWRNDDSNETVDYDRNYIRLQVVPLLKKLNPALEEVYGTTLERLEGALELVQESLEKIEKQFIRKQQDLIKIDKDVLKLISKPQVLLWELVKSYGFNYTQCAQAVAAALGSSGKFFLSGSHQLTVDRDHFIVSPNMELGEPIVIESKDQDARWGNMLMKIRQLNQFEIQNDHWMAALDADNIEFPLVWRQWKPGDYFVPLGLGHRKKLSDFLIDQKLSLPEKKNVSVLESKGNIIWVPGYRIDDRFKVTDSTQQVVLIQVMPYFE